MPDLLIELFSEEIPARMQAKAASDLQKRMTDGLVEAGLTYAGARAFATPRRLTLTVSGLTAESPTIREERKGPRTDAPEKAIDGFLRGAGLTKDQLQVRDDKKGQVYFAIIEKPGRPVADIVAELLEDTIRNFPWPKSMRWGAGTLRWVRPLQSILCILYAEDGAQIVPFQVDDIHSGDVTQGHRFMSKGAIKVTSFEDYETKLKRAHVVLDAAERADQIWHDATNMAFAQGLEVVEDKGLLAEVAGLVEWPVVLMGKIGTDYLDLPPEVLQTSMKEHQKFFSVRDPKSGKIVKFVTVANRETTDNGATILAGNEKVLSARLADAKFFWENDLRVAKADMQPWLDSLANVTFHNKLGSQGDRINRIAALAREIAPLVGANADQAEEAARFAKADLASEMVYEFPELQGVMGRYYLQAAGKSDNIAAAAEHHYSPLGPSDDVPTDPVSVAVALADKIDTLTGFWAIDDKPTGSKDPYALRRAALGVIRLVFENSITAPLLKILDNWLEKTIVLSVHYGQVSPASLKSNPEIHEKYLEVTGSGQTEDGNDYEDNEILWDVFRADAADLLAFIHDRLKVHLRDEGIRHDVIDACISMPGNDDLTLLVKRARALSAFLKTDDGENLLQGFKRANNILTQAEDKDGVEYSYGADIKFAEMDEEKALFTALDAADTKITPAMDAEDFETAMTAMAALRAPIDAFFEAVQVNDESEILRRNRLNLLSRIRTICLSVADLTRIDG
ncbi:glycine--tRNA ligase subunit beta [Parasulfitobacter algicola]|uniref:Glycine--tRNA ligase beta subunit n=1 Tax=Parasulfitobacter algicola TaxID=2614809 RepID=A0ABX2IQ71_9RHOB|nr:glycine--tRNA ligase subunit beta [Sulfitobacter algicola]NSX54705.1 glycine--tRNA ligase subunit beta [Sulfitobacter algicola]